eukprot:364707-Chlamydomonas_euryale.AAC.13
MSRPAFSTVNAAETATVGRRNGRDTGRPAWGRGVRNAPDTAACVAEENCSTVANWSAQVWLFAIARRDERCCVAIGVGVRAALEHSASQVWTLASVLSEREPRPLLAGAAGHIFWGCAES